MKNFSIYELLSYILPGFLIVVLVKYGLETIDFELPIKISDKFDDSVFTLILSLLIGVAIHVLTYRLIQWKWYQKKVYYPIQSCVNNSKSIQSIIPSITEKYIARNNQKVNENEDLTDNLFDFCYYYLETNGIDRQVKSFQGFYFLFRNLFTSLLISLPLMAILGVLYKIKNPSEKLCWLFLTACIYIIFYFIILELARFMRKKMITRVFWSYHVHQLHQTNK